jgi:hypothetical protein
MLICWITSPVLAQDLYIEKIFIAKDVENLNPMETGLTFSSDVKKLYCFTKISGATSKTTITHVWYKDNQVMSRINLPVNSSSWRTYSSIEILPNWKGHWWVEIIHGESAKGFIDFTIE